MAPMPSHPVGLEDLTDLEGVAVEGCPLEPLYGLVHGAHLPQPIPADEFFGLREWPIDDRAILAIESNALGLRAWIQAAIPDHDPCLEQVLVELLESCHCLGRRRGGRLALIAFLCQYQYTHRCLLV